jgi:hypothetical protein
MLIVEIPGGEAIFREELKTERQHRIIQRGMLVGGGAIAKLAQSAAADGQTEVNLAEIAVVDLTEAEADGIFYLQDMVILAFLERWTLDRDLPTAETIQDLEHDLYQALQEGAAPLVEKVLGEAPPDFSPQPLPKDDNLPPTGGSIFSVTTSLDEKENRPTETLSNGGWSTSTGNYSGSPTTSI